MDDAQLVLFDYRQLDVVTSRSMQQRAERIRKRSQTIAINVWENGQDFYEAQQELAQHRYGFFQDWAERETGYSIRTVYNFIRVYQTFNRANFAQLNFAPSALYVLAAPSTPNGAIEEAVERSQNGERITHAAAKEIIAEYKGLSPTEVVHSDLGSYRRLPHNTKQCEQCRQLWAADLDYCPYCHIKPEVRAFYVEQERTKPHVSYNSGNNEWYTPRQYIEAARTVLGEIELDPASNDAANEIIQAVTYYTANDDGLTHDWFGRVWMNPPYAKGLVERFAEKLVYHHGAGDVPEAIVLVNNATETGWFRCLAAASKAICFPSSRVRFWNPDGESSEPLQGQAILYMGDDVDAFTYVFSQFGFLVKVL